LKELLRFVESISKNKNGKGLAEDKATERKKKSERRRRISPTV
jgi:hypothetical protein